MLSAISLCLLAIQPRQVCMKRVGETEILGYLNHEVATDDSTTKEGARINTTKADGVWDDWLNELNDAGIQEGYYAFQDEMKRRDLLDEDTKRLDLTGGPDDGCKKKCNPTRCQWKKGVFDLKSKKVGHKWRSTCVLKPELRPDEELTAKMCYLSAYVIRKSNKFKAQGMLAQFIKLKSYMSAMDEPKLALAGGRASKPMLSRLMGAYESQEIKKFKDTLNEMCILPNDLQIKKEQGQPPTQGHLTYHIQFWKKRQPIQFSGQDYRTIARDLVVRNIDKGFKKSWLLTPMRWIFQRAFGKNFSIGELLENVGTPLYEASSVPEKMEVLMKVAPKLEPHQALLKERLEGAEQDAKTAKAECLQTSDPDLCFQKKFKEALRKQASVQPSQEQIDDLDREQFFVEELGMREDLEATIERDMEELAEMDAPADADNGNGINGDGSLMEAMADRQAMGVGGFPFNTRFPRGWAGLFIVLSIVNYCLMIFLCGPLVITGPAGGACWGTMIPIQAVFHIAVGLFVQIGEDMDKVKPFRRIHVEPFRRS